jgi:hypothetical protein
MSVLPKWKQIKQMMEAGVFILQGQNLQWLFPGDILSTPSTQQEIQKGGKKQKRGGTNWLTNITGKTRETPMASKPTVISNITDMTGPSIPPKTIKYDLNAAPIKTLPYITITDDARCITEEEAYLGVNFNIINGNTQCIPREFNATTNTLQDESLNAYLNTLPEEKFYLPTPIANMTSGEETGLPQTIPSGYGGHLNYTVTTVGKDEVYHLYDVPLDTLLCTVLCKTYYDFESNKSKTVTMKTAIGQACLLTPGLLERNDVIPYFNEFLITTMKTWALNMECVQLGGYIIPITHTPNMQYIPYECNVLDFSKWNKKNLEMCTIIQSGMLLLYVIFLFFAFLKLINSTLFKQTVTGRIFTHRSILVELYNKYSNLIRKVWQENKQCYRYVLEKIRRTHAPSTLTAPLLDEEQAAQLEQQAHAVTNEIFPKFQETTIKYTRVEKAPTLAASELSRPSDTLNAGGRRRRTRTRRKRIRQNRRPLSRRRSAA